VLHVTAIDTTDKFVLNISSKKFENKNQRALNTNYLPTVLPTLFK
jgi:hypothetical protein